ncbi:MAG: DUF2851 family protein [bacterium]|nr:DUF2851 family protein [bacterium]
MLKFSEELLQFIWQHRLLLPKPLITQQGKEVKVIKPGDLNKNAGPDFFNAQIGIRDLVLVGNIEVHLYTSDWLKHGHQQDRSYDNIILHVVYEHDEDLPQNINNNVEVLELKDLIAPATISRYQQICSEREKLPCTKHLSDVEDLIFSTWMERMAVERLEEKVKRIEKLFEEFDGDYTQTFYSLLFRNFGFKVNSVPFEVLSKHLPVQLLLKHSDNLQQVEALLLGMAGLLDDQFENKYIQQLQNEFEYLRRKYTLIPLKKEIFKFSKLRPANFPNLRLAQLAMLLHVNRTLFLKPHTYSSYGDIKTALTITLEGYWKNHYTIDGNALTKELKFGTSSAENVMINTFAPFFFFYSKKLVKPQYGDLALDLLNACETENNVKTRLFSAKRPLPRGATVSQGIINLYDHYCSAKRCLNCGIASSILKKP